MSRRARSRKGNIIVLSGMAVVIFVGVTAFAIDLGHMLTVRTQLQRSSDAAALAACWDLIDERAFTDDFSEPIANSRATAEDFAEQNLVAGQAPHLATGDSEGGQDDVRIGFVAEPSNPDSPLVTANAPAYNAVEVRVRRTQGQNGSIALFFGRIFGWASANMEATGTAAFMPGVKGFEVPEDGSNLGILPIALDEETWDALIAGNAPDNYTWHGDHGHVHNGSDGMREVSLYPTNTGSPGNRGMVDIGSSNNSTADVSRQIVEGISPSDLAYHGGKLELNDAGELYLNADPGISAGVKDELASIIGQPRIIPIFRSVTGNGNNATYTIVKFVGIRILKVKLTGKNSNKHVIVQPAGILTDGAISDPTAEKSDLIFTRVHLIR